MKFKKIIISIPDQENLPNEIPIGEIYGHSNADGFFGAQENKNHLREEYTTTWDYKKKNPNGRFLFFFETQEQARFVMENVYHYDYEIIDGNLVLTLADDTMSRHEAAQKHNAPGYAYMDAIHSFEVNVAAVIDGIKTAMIRLEELASSPSSETAAARRKFLKAINACDKIDLHAGQEWVECVHFAYRLHNDFMSAFVGRHNTPQNHANAAAYAKHIADKYYREVILTDAETGEKKHDAIFLPNGLYARPRLPSVKLSGVRRTTTAGTLLGMRRGYEYDPADFANGKLTAAGEAKIDALVVAADESRAMPPDDTDSAPPTVEPAADGDSDNG